MSPRVNSWTLAAIVDAALVLGILTLLCGLAGIGDDTSDAVEFTVLGVCLTVVLVAVRRRVVRPSRSVARKVIAGIGILWVVLIGACAAVYVSTGSRLDDAVVEATAGLTTTAITVLDVNEVSRTLLLWRASTGWLGGLIAILVSVVALPRVLQGSGLFNYSSSRRGFDLVPNTAVGISRVVALYSGFTAACVLAYFATGLGLTESAVLGLGTSSTGGFSPRVDSFASYGTATSVVATAGMVIAGSSIFVLWWVLRGRTRPLMRSQELKLYLLLVVFVAAIVTVGSSASPLEAMFTAASVVSTTGYSSTDWTIWPSLATTTLILAVGIGSMLGSPGGGVRVLRARLIFDYARRELRRQLNPHSVVLIRRNGNPVNDSALDRIGSYQITHMAMIGTGAAALGIAGLSVTGSLWTSVSALSTMGPAVGEIGAFGDVSDLSHPARIVLVPLMLAGRVAILPFLAMLGFITHSRRSVLRWARRLGWRAWRRLEVSRRYQAHRERRINRNDK